MTTSPYVAIDGRRFLPVYVPAGVVAAQQVDALVAMARNAATDTLEYAASRTFGPADALLPPGQRTGLDESEMEAVTSVLPACGYAGLLLREYDDSAVARAQAVQMRKTEWFSPWADSVSIVYRRIEPSQSRYGVFIVDTAALTDTGKHA